MYSFIFFSLGKLDPISLPASPGDFIYTSFKSMETPFFCPLPPSPIKKKFFAV